MTESTRSRILYFYDALCGWCYGFSPVIRELYDQYGATTDFEVISGGMVTGDRIGPIGETAPYIKSAYRDVEERSGIKFGEAFLKGVLDEGSTVFTSIPPAIALAIVKAKLPDRAVPFAGRLQSAIYFDGLAPADLQAYGTLAEEFGMDGELFVKDLSNPEYQEAAEADFRQTAYLGISGFPTVILEKPGNQFYLLSRGYVSYPTLERTFQKVLQLEDV